MDVDNQMVHDSTIFIFGGSGSLGNALVKRYLRDNNLYIFSRDESKHWQMRIDYAYSDHLNFIVGDIRDKQKVKESLMRTNPDTIIVASALKHVDICEYETHECIETNIIGVKNVLDVIVEAKDCHVLDNLKTICFISTDKACSPVNVYGMSKAISECMMVEKARRYKDSNISFVTVRYGNVLNSRGSIIPVLNQIGMSQRVDHYKLTHDQMTRFIMTLDDCVDLIEHAITEASSGDIVIPSIRSMYVKDLIEIFAEKYEKPIVKTSLRPGEKIAETLVNATQSRRLAYSKCKKYMYIKPTFHGDVNTDNSIVREYDSTHALVSKGDLCNILKELGI